MARRALVLGGGGAKGAYQVGMLEVLVDKMGLDFQILRGTSVGALNAAFLAQSPTGQKSLQNLQAAVVGLTKLWLEEVKGNHSIYDERAFGLVGLAAGKDSLLDNDPLNDLIRKHLDPAKMRTSGRDFAVGTVSLVSGNFQEHKPTAPNYLDLILASTAMPVVFPPVWREEKGEEKDVLVDGGVRETTPLSSAFRAKPGPDEIYVLLTSRALKRPDGSFPVNAAMATRYGDWDDNFLGTSVSGLDVLKRTVELLTDEVYLDDIRGALQWNRILEDAQKLVAAAKAASGPAALGTAAAALETSLTASRKRPVTIKVLAPREWYGEHNSSTAFAPELIKKAIAHGREVAADPKLWLWP
ncbi:MAG TPA: patatin-like phospholipase family protein [Planctomycetota bacterium]